MANNREKASAPLLEQAVADLNRIYLLKGVETARALGEYILSTFYDGDVEALRRKSKRHHSFRGLARRPDLLMSYSVLCRSVAVAEQLRILPEDIASSLSYTQHRALLPVKDDVAKVELARQAVREGLTAQDLQEHVRNYRRTAQSGVRLGRPPLHPLVKQANAIGRVVAGLPSGDVGRELIDDLPDPDAVRLGSNLMEQAQRLHRLGHQLVNRGSADGFRRGKGS